MLSSYQGDENTGRRYKNHALTYLLVSVPGAKLVSQRSLYIESYWWSTAQK